jgi:hypothetical protein
MLSGISLADKGDLEKEYAREKERSKKHKKVGVAALRLKAQLHHCASVTSDTPHRRCCACGRCCRPTAAMPIVRVGEEEEKEAEREAQEEQEWVARAAARAVLHLCRKASVATLFRASHRRLEARPPTPPPPPPHGPTLSGCTAVQPDIINNQGACTGYGHVVHQSDPPSSLHTFPFHTL